MRRTAPRVPLNVANIRGGTAINIVTDHCVCSWFSTFARLDELWWPTAAT